MEFQPHPLRFNPIFKEKIWGGQKLRTELNKEIPFGNIGESWEISTVENDISVVSEGVYKGRSLNSIINEFPREILGSNVYQRFGKQFPLLFKFIDAKEDLSIQVHPNDKLAKERHNSFGKTEMWYIMQADQDARIIVGFSEESSADDYLKFLNEKRLPELLDRIAINPGDVFFLETGTIHAIGSGTLLAEIQQTSDITYRVYDWDRVDDNDQSRELHIDLALDAINYDKVDSKRTYQKEINSSNEVVECPFFTTRFIPLNDAMSFSKDGSSFTVLMCVDGNFTINTNDYVQQFKKGDTVLIPASLENFKLSGIASILEIFIS